MEKQNGLMPNPADCGNCRKFLPTGTRIADRFVVKQDDCVLLNTGRACLCLILASGQDVIIPDNYLYKKPNNKVE